MGTTETTVPLPPVAAPIHHHRIGDRVTWLYLDEHDQPVRLVGTVVWSNTWTFQVRWDENRGEGRFVHNHEPDTLRAATPHDERDALTRTTRNTVARELMRLADTHPTWPDEVRHTLRTRATDLTGSLR